MVWIAIYKYATVFPVIQIMNLLLKEPLLPALLKINEAIYGLLHLVAVCIGSIMENTRIYGDLSFAELNEITESLPPESSISDELEEMDVKSVKIGRAHV